MQDCLSVNVGLEYLTALAIVLATWKGTYLKNFVCNYALAIYCVFWLQIGPLERSIEEVDFWAAARMLR